MKDNSNLNSSSLTNEERLKLIADLANDFNWSTIGRLIYILATESSVEAISKYMSNNSTLLLKTADDIRSYVESVK